eukprot:978543-Prorocentrum_minimum.AAC.1
MSSATLMHSLVILVLTVQGEGLAKNEDERPDYLSKETPMQNWMKRAKNLHNAVKGVGAGASTGLGSRLSAHVSAIHNHVKISALGGLLMRRGGARQKEEVEEEMEEEEEEEEATPEEEEAKPEEEEAKPEEKEAKPAATPAVGGLESQSSPFEVFSKGSAALPVGKAETPESLKEYKALLDQQPAAGEGEEVKNPYEGVQTEPGSVAAMLQNIQSDRCYSEKHAHDKCQSAHHATKTAKRQKCAPAANAYRLCMKKIGQPIPAG